MQETLSRFVATHGAPSADDILATQRTFACPYCLHLKADKDRNIPGWHFLNDCPKVPSWYTITHNPGNRTPRGRTPARTPGAALAARTPTPGPAPGGGAVTPAPTPASALRDSATAPPVPGQCKHVSWCPSLSAAGRDSPVCVADHPSSLTDSPPLSPVSSVTTSSDVQLPPASPVAPIAPVPVPAVAAPPPPLLPPALSPGSPRTPVALHAYAYGNSLQPLPIRFLGSSYATTLAFSPESSICIDSGATYSMTPSLADFVSYTTVSDTFITAANGESMPVAGQGTVRLLLGDKIVEEHGWLHLPGIAMRLKSVRMHCRLHPDAFFLASNEEVILGYPTFNLHIDDKEDVVLPCSPAPLAAS
ncbi:MAG: hypothetical protein ACRCYW_14645, partial [Aeromonas sp.]|uniref:hypothetical protein n=1 Tax=Aeromonas sp. TaxID=647 RepID=UPI003F35D4ED